MLIELGAAEELSNFLASDATPDDCMDIVMLDGFLTSLVCSPVPIPPSAWTPVIWGTGRPVFASTAHANRIVQLIAQQMKGIADTLRDYPEIFLPLIDSTPDGSPDLESGEDWCIGFMNGVELREDVWQPLLENAAAEEIMIPVTLLALHGAAPETLEEKIDDPVIYAASLQLLPEAVTGIYQYWHGQKKGQGVSLPSAKIGRNEPCPCGSGKKFKKCCGMR